MEQETLVDQSVREPIDWRPPMYAIAFDLDTAALKRHYPGPSYNNGYKEIEDILGSHGFDRQQGSVYYGNGSITSVSTVLAVQDLSRQLPWFKNSVGDIRVLQLMANDDLSEAL